MLTLTSQKNVKAVLVMLIMSLIFFAESVQAKKGRGGNGRAGWAGSQNRQTAKGQTAGKAEQRRNARKSHRKKAAPPAQSAGPALTSRPARSWNSDGAKRHGIREDRKSHGKKPGHSITDKPTVDVSRPDRSPFDTKKRPSKSFDTGKPAKGPFNTDKPTVDVSRPDRRPFDTERQPSKPFGTSKPAKGPFSTGRPSRHQFGADSSTRHRPRWDSQTAGRHRGRASFDYGGSYRHQPRRIFNRIVWPRHRRTVYYDRGPGLTFRYFYPYHHRKYVFVSLGGFWPIHYDYVRYYRYGCHPYYWYGHNPTTYVVEGDTYNYYYDSDDYGTDSYTGGVSDGIAVVDENTFADVREKLAAQQPAAETPADKYFEDAVKAFEAAGYAEAAGLLAEAVELEPDDIVLPFAYIQALFADEQYQKAVGVLRQALRNLPPNSEGVFYPRGLYPSDDILFEQIDHLDRQAELYHWDDDLKLMLGYQLLGIGELDRAAETLGQIEPDSQNADSAAMLLELLEKIKTDNTENADT